MDLYSPCVFALIVSCGKECISSTFLLDWIHKQCLQYNILSSYSRLYISHILYYSLCQLTQLEKLDIGENPFNTVPEVVSSLTSLKKLNMSDCKISTLHERFVSHIFCID